MHGGFASDPLTENTAMIFPDRKIVRGNSAANLLACPPQNKLSRTCGWKACDKNHIAKGRIQSEMPRPTCVVLAFSGIALRSPDLGHSW